MTYSDILLTLNFDPNFASLSASQKKALVNIQGKKLYDCIKGNSGCRDFYACGNEIVDISTTPSSTFNVCVEVLTATPSSTFNVCVGVLTATPSSTFNVCI